MLAKHIIMCVGLLLKKISTFLHLIKGDPELKMFGVCSVSPEVYIVIFCKMINFLL
jgi:hypothetical protein